MTGPGEGKVVALQGVGWLTGSVVNVIYRFNN